MGIIFRYFTTYPRGFNFRTKLIVLLSVVTLIVSGTTGFITYNIHLNMFNEEVSRQYSLTTDQVLARLDSRVNDMYRVTDYITLNPAIKKAISEQKAGIDSFERMKIEDELDEQLFQVRLDAPEIMGIRIYDLKGNVIHLGTYASSFQRLSQTYLHSMAHKLEGTGGEYVWNRLDSEASGQQESANWVMAGRLMRALDMETFGEMLILFHTSLFESYLKDLRQHQDAAAYLYDQNGQLLYIMNSGLEQEAVLPADLRTGDNRIVKEEGTSYLYTKQVSDKVGFTLITKVSLKQIQSRGQIIWKVAVISALATILFSSLITALISRRLLRPLTKLVQAMKRVREGKFDTRVLVQNRDELDFLGDSFNRMTSRIETLIREVYERELSEKEAELKAIQAQLNPHFLYNTLGMFFWKFYMLEDERSAQLVNSLSEMLRYTLEPVEDRTTLRDEINQIEHYFQIQKARYQEALFTYIDIPGDLLDCRMIRLLLQPIVENAFVHAFRDMRSDRRLSIRGYKRKRPPETPGSNETDLLVLEITDNGCGMDAAAVRQILTLSRHRDAERQSIGTSSVIRRIALVHGEPYGVDVKSKVGEGTTVSLYLPYDLKRREEKADDWEAVGR
ncbi:sensor histidine kinase [Paenibacillus fonticola]|uniref:sensor histidine kinase n=1 Tax=Paenibacillus fonticola TaxID=379896 RepID=UPI000378A9CE|nr:histidine kinase [Paenibacillus fonticola]